MMYYSNETHNKKLEALALHVRLCAVKQRIKMN